MVAPYRGLGGGHRSPRAEGATGVVQGVLSAVYAWRLGAQGGGLPEGGGQVTHTHGDMEGALAPLVEGNVKQGLELGVGILSDVDGNLFSIELLL